MRCFLCKAHGLVKIVMLIAIEDSPDLIIVSSLNSGVNRSVLMDFLLCSNHRPEVLTIPAAVQSKLTVEQRTELMRRFEAGENRSQLARDFGIDRVKVHRYCSGTDI